MLVWACYANKLSGGVLRTAPNGGSASQPRWCKYAVVLGPAEATNTEGEGPLRHPPGWESPQYLKVLV